MYTQVPSPHIDLTENKNTGRVAEHLSINTMAYSTALKIRKLVSTLKLYNQNIHKQANSLKRDYSSNQSTSLVELQQSIE